MAEKGKRYKVRYDSHGKFNKGDIVVAIESDDVAHFVLEENYVEGKEEDDYSAYDYAPLCDKEIEEIENEVIYA